MGFWILHLATWAVTKMDVSKNSGTPQIIHFNRVFHYKPSILGYPYFLKHLNLGKTWCQGFGSGCSQRIPQSKSPVNDRMNCQGQLVGWKFLFSNRRVHLLALILNRLWFQRFWEFLAATIGGMVQFDSYIWKRSSSRSQLANIASLWTPKPWKMKVLGPKIWVVSPKNEGYGFPWSTLIS